ncbi:MAG: hypothetical protein K9N51_00720 [Candidatus Pacebacteria bacterium]|nr:hypothetical protein [Candidatus Paceibacterota bacterium]
MRKWQRTVLAGAIGLTLLMGIGHAAEKNEPATPPMTAPVFREAPAIDGKIEPREWRGAHGFEGFT